nr:alanine racemase [uncultured Desulfuromonas sp.]
MKAYRPTRVAIDLDALRHNYQVVRTTMRPDWRLLAVVKADAYGHGAIPIARTLEDAGADLFGVAIVEEGLELRAAGISRPILMLGGPWPGQESVVIEHDLHVAVFEIGQLQRLEQAARQAGKRCFCHLKIDSGMGRLGVRDEQLDEVLQFFLASEALQLVGIMTHFALADCPDHPLTAQQQAHFKHALAKVHAAGFEPEYIHSANSAATFTQVNGGCNLVRPGIALYGGQPFEERHLPLKPVMAFRTEIAHLKHLPTGSGVSYGHRFVAQRPTLIAAIPVGYADGYNRLLSNCGTALVHGQNVSVAGTVCMDWTLLDVTDVANVQCGDTVTLLGCDGDQCVLAEQWAEKVGTISYEVFCQISKRVPRHYLPQVP